MAKNGFSMSNRVATEEVNAAKTLTVNDCGKVFLLNASASANFTITLPEVASAEAGWNASFIVSTSGSVAKQVTVSKASGDSASIIKLRQVLTSTDAGGEAVAQSTVVFPATTLQVGDRMDIVTEGTAWYAKAMTSGGLT